MVGKVSHHRGQSPTLIMATFMISLAGMLIHNFWDLPGLTMLSPENFAPATIWLLLAILWWGFGHHAMVQGLLLLWGVVHLVGGGILSVLPLGFLPYYPAQTLHHYLGHLIYFGLQIPLIVVMVGQLRRK